jgi:hypothetical protein
VNIEATNITVIRPGFKIELDANELPQLWAELATLMAVWDQTKMPMYITRELIDALHKEIG